MDAASLLALFGEVSDAVRSALDGLDDWGAAPGHPGQYRHDVVADEVAVPLLLDAGLGVLSEESGSHGGDRRVFVVIDPIDGSTNAQMGLPWFATSLCAVDGDGPVAAMVVNQATGVVYTAARGEGARRDGEAISPSGTVRLEDAILALNDWPPARIGCRQFRALGAAALELCAVADGTVDGFVDFSVGLAPWDHLAALLVCREAGAVFEVVGGDDLSDLRTEARTRLVAAGSSALCAALAAMDAR